MRPENLVKEIGYLTPDTIPDERLCRSFSIPNDTAWLGTFMGAITPLLTEEAWRKFGTLTPEECVAEWQRIFFSFETACAVEIDAPYWDTAANVDDEEPETSEEWYGYVTDPEEDPATITWIENAFIWGLTGFIAFASWEVGFAPAILFHTIAPKFVLAWKRGDVGEVIRVIIDGNEAARVDTTSASVGDIIETTIIADPTIDLHELLIVQVS